MTLPNGNNEWRKTGDGNSRIRVVRIWATSAHRTGAENIHTALDKLIKWIYDSILIVLQHTHRFTSNPMFCFFIKPNILFLFDCNCFGVSLNFRKYFCYFFVIFYAN